MTVSPRCWRALALVALCFGSAWSAMAGEEPMSEESTVENASGQEPAVYYVLFHSPGPEWNGELSFREQPGIGAHVGYMAGLLERGLIVMGGPYLDDSGGMMVSRAQTLEEAEKLAQDDPAVRAGLLTVEVKAWYVPMSSVRPTAEPQEDEQPAALSETASAPPAEADEPPPCSSPEHRQFDFWLGFWEVRRPDGALAGTNRVELLYDGCALRENWQGTSGSVGTSLNLYDAERGVWHQTWVDGQGGLLLLEGGLDGDAMVMRGRRPSGEDPSVEVLHEIRWEPLEGGRVRQLWRASKDDGESWQTLFDGLYSPAP